ncbi:hypothetical protein GTA08_BOTSDO01636 [Neofusicoccum parvum]|uniref:Uncharacterized protein n=1 Tax=Neofusicoccum parvum TaxID=310453 RepID=A0ACB5S0Q8_9PEZI|nr:hypothetical protein GTA08_BOTSDO01636 [Neofusicoccum parvum]GME48249.1 hypothetical protein GTA08_BOTSDO01636 [Neofusicoccum parvum]
MVLFAGYTLGIIAVMVFPCVPVAKSWDYTITGGRCVNRTMTLMAAALVNIVGELALLLVPMPILMKLQMPRMQKFGLFCMFAVGMLTCITSIVRLAVLAPILTDSDRDRPWSYSIPCVWIVAEANLITVCGCLPVTKKFLRHVAPRLIGESSSSSSSFAIGTGAAYANGGSTPLRTIGSMRSRPKRARLGVECHPLEMDEGESEEGEGQSPENERIRAWSDGGSETAIVVTKRTTVESVRESDERRSGGCGQPMGLPETMRSGGFA